jgi:hypothetical protein
LKGCNNHAHILDVKLILRESPVGKNTGHLFTQIVPCLKLLEHIPWYKNISVASNCIQGEHTILLSSHSHESFEFIPYDVAFSSSGELKCVYAHNLVDLVRGHHILILVLEEWFIEYFLDLPPQLRHINFVRVTNVHKHNVIPEWSVLHHLLILHLLQQGFNNVLVLRRCDSWEEEKNILTHFGSERILFNSYERLNLINKRLRAEASYGKRHQSSDKIVQVHFLIDLAFILLEVYNSLI